MPGLDDEQLALLLPHVCLLPDAESLLNVNTLNAQTLAALTEEASLAIAEPLVGEAREFDDVKQFVETNDAFAKASAILDVRSEYFALHAIAQVGESSVTLLSLLKRDDSGQVTVLQRDFGKLFRSNLAITTEEGS